MEPIDGRKVVRDVFVAKVADTLARLGYGGVAVGGRADLSFDRGTVSVVWDADWAAGLAAALLTSLKCDSRPFCVILVPSDCADPEGRLSAARTVAAHITPQVTVWVLSAGAGTLDMGDGRVINVG